MSNGRIVRITKDTGSPLPRIGFVKIGMKNKSGYPMSLDYFIADGTYKKYFDEVYQKPGVIQIVFFNDSPEFSCKEQYILTDKDGKRFGYGDGHDFEIWNGKEYVPVSLDEHPSLMDAAIKRSGSKKGWEITLTLRFIIPKIPKVLGYWEFNTKGSASTIPQIRQSYDMLLESRGSVMGMVFDLNVSFAKSQQPGKANKYPVVSLVANHMDDNLNIMKNSFTSLAYKDNLKSLTEGENID